MKLLMEITRSPETWGQLMKLAGEIDLHSSPQLRRELQACAAEKSPALLVDFSAVEYIDSSGLATLIEYVRDTATNNGKIALFGLSSKVRTIFDLVRLNELFVISETPEEALAALKIQ